MALLLAPAPDFTFGYWSGSSPVTPKAAVSQDGRRFAYGWMVQLQVSDRLAGSSYTIPISQNGALKSHPQWSPDGRYLAYQDADLIKLLDYDTKQVYHSFSLGRATDSVNLSWSPSEKTLAFSSGTFGHNSVKFFDLKSRAVKETSLLNQDSPVTRLSWIESLNLLLVEKASPVLLKESGEAVFAAGRDSRYGQVFVLPSRGKKGGWEMFAAKEGAWHSVARSGIQVEGKRPGFWSLREDQTAVTAADGSAIAYQENDTAFCLQKLDQSPVTYTGTQRVDEMITSGQGKWLLVRRSTSFDAVRIRP